MYARTRCCLVGQLLNYTREDLSRDREIQKEYLSAASATSPSRRVESSSRFAHSPACG